ncbi:hypothetical protein GWI33_005496 [Rhynchophorus ferrugineus]|uniref:Uncharacterized protein n=1 Tax=Rhynchophorus ferrugineus TaxID=354439 RepID=A0A834IVU3_RHYFE|nr:hypothetical protein GWI33_005496 [Rhynchophorus ferrugineus]
MENVSIIRFSVYGILSEPRGTVEIRMLSSGARKSWPGRILKLIRFAFRVDISDLCFRKVGEDQNSVSVALEREKDDDRRFVDLRSHFPASFPTGLTFVVRVYTAVLFRCRITDVLVGVERERTVRSEALTSARISSKKACVKVLLCGSSFISKCHHRSRKGILREAMETQLEISRSDGPIMQV